MDFMQVMDHGARDHIFGPLRCTCSEECCHGKLQNFYAVLRSLLLLNSDPVAKNIGSH